MNFSKYEVKEDKYCFFNKDNNPIYVTNCYIVEFIREIEPNG